jgi:DNA-binding response OmpR family regulator
MRDVPPRILLLEDDEEIAFTFELFLKLEDYEITHIADGAVGLEAMSTEKFDLCVLNVGLPNLSGYQIAEQRRERNVDVPLLFLTASSRSQVAD